MVYNFIWILNGKGWHVVFHAFLHSCQIFLTENSLCDLCFLLFLNTEPKLGLLRFRKSKKRPGTRLSLFHSSFRRWHEEHIKNQKDSLSIRLSDVPLYKASGVTKGHDSFRLILLKKHFNLLVLA